MQGDFVHIFEVGRQVDGWSIYILLPSHTYTTNERPIAVVTNATCTHVLSIT